MTATRRHIICITLRTLGERLPFGHFQRVHRSYIVNTQRIDAVEDHLLHLGPYKVPVGKSYQNAFYRSLRSLYGPSAVREPPDVSAVPVPR